MAKRSKHLSMSEFWSAAFPLIFLTLAAPAYAQGPCNNTAPGRCYSPCDETWVAQISGGGDVIVLSTGYAYDVDPSDRETVIGWVKGGPNVGDHVLVCDTGLLVDMSRPGRETAKVRPHH